MNSQNFIQKRGLVIGSNGEIGSIICSYFDLNGISYTPTFFSGDKNGICLNLEDRSSIDSLLEKFKNYNLDFIVFNASLTPNRYEIEALKNLDYINKFFAINVSSLIYLVENLSNYRISVKSFIIISSEAALSPTRKHLAYNASKAAQLNLYDSLCAKFTRINWYIMLISSKVKNDYKHIIIKEIEGILQNQTKSQKIFFRKKRSFLSAAHDLALAILRTYSKNIIFQKK